MRIAVCYPTRSRTQQSVDCLKRLIETAPDVPVYVVTEDDLTPFREIGSPNIHVYPCAVNTSPVEKWNWAALLAGDVDGYFLGADDLWWEPGWHEELIAVARSSNKGIISINDTVEESGWVNGTHYLAKREYCMDVLGQVFVVPHYRGHWFDVENTRSAKRIKQYDWAEKAIVRHRHWNSKYKYEFDDNYKRQGQWGRYDNMVFLYREQSLWPIDYSPILV